MSLSKLFHSRLCLGLRKRLNHFLDTSHLHGVHFLGKRCGIVGKSFWLTVMILSMLAMKTIFLLTLNYFNTDAVSIGIDTAFLTWNNTFPAVSICLTKGRKSQKIRDFVENQYRDSNITFNKRFTYYKALHSLIFMTPNDDMDVWDQCSDTNASCGVDLGILRNLLVPNTCREFMKNVQFSGHLYENCDEVFKLSKTPMGFCYLANNVLFHFDSKQLPLKYNRKSVNRKLEFRFKQLDVASLSMYIHSPEDLPYFNSLEYLLHDNAGGYGYYYNLMEIDNEIDVINEPIDRRGCRFPHETWDNSEYPYSFSLCLTELRIKLELEYCNCTLYTGRKKYQNVYCDINGLHCLSQFEFNIMAKELHYEEQTSCLPSCEEMELSEDEEYINSDDEFTNVTIEILNVPSLRYRRDVAYSQLNLVVAIGGVAGLFFGASILSIVEIFHIWCIRKFN